MGGSFIKGKCLDATVISGEHVSMGDSYNLGICMGGSYIRGGRMGDSYNWGICMGGTVIPGKGV